MPFLTVRRLEAFLNGYLQAGDLVLLKGTENVDHLHRLALSRLGGIACWREKCGHYRYCLDCRLLHRPAASGEPEPACRGRERRWPGEGTVLGIRIAGLTPRYAQDSVQPYRQSPTSVLQT